jgi:hypothetical protein
MITKILDITDKIALLIPEDKSDAFDALLLQLLKVAVHPKGQILSAEDMRNVHAENFPEWYANMVIQNEIQITCDLLCGTIHTKYDSIARGITPNPVIVKGVKDYFEKLGYDVKLERNNLLVISWEKGNTVKENG